jgi:hypothetical protein
MARRSMGCAVMVCGLACASTNTRVFQARSVWSTDQTEVAQLGPGHFGGRWTNHAIDILRPGQGDEEIFVCTESGTFDGVWTAPDAVSSCGIKSTKVCKHPDGTMTYDIAATCRPGPDGLLVFEGGASVVGATGRFEGIQGKFTFKSWQVVPGPHDYGYTLGTAEMTASKR